MTITISTLLWIIGLFIILVFLLRGLQCHPIPKESIIFDIQQKYEAPVDDRALEEIISIRIIAPHGRTFEGERLFQTILAYDFLFSKERQIFYRYSENDHRDILFSLAAVNKPGDFEMTAIEHFSCPGVVLFMDISQHDNPRVVFEMLLKVARGMAIDLEGELKLDSTQILTQSVIDSIRLRLSAAVL